MISTPLRPSQDTLRSLIEAQASARPDTTYAVATESGVSIDFGTLARDGAALGRWLCASGSAPGEVIGFVMPNGLQTLRLLLGAMHGGWCVCPINLLSQTAQMRYVLEHSDCSIVFVSPDREVDLRAAIEGLARPMTVIVTDPDSVGGVANLPPAVRRPGKAVQVALTVPDPTPQTPALLMYTSGTTGHPKGVLLSHSNLVANARAISAEHGLTSLDRVLGVLPLYHINAFTVTMLAPLAHGGSVAIAPKFSGARFWAQALDMGCTWINVVPTIISYLLEGEDPAPALRTRIRFCRSASAALPPEHLRAFEARFGIDVVETMGLTETAAPAFSNPMQATARKLGSVGRASGCEACVVDGAVSAEPLPDGVSDLVHPLPDGKVGEILIRGPNVMQGYYKNEAATRATFTADGWLRTGDLGYRDADGFFFVTGRIKELIIKGGENIAPREIDEVLLRHPAVLEAAAVGVPDRHYGQEIVACIVLRAPDDGKVGDQIRAFCHEHLGRYKTPRDLHFVDALPRGPSGKVQRLKMLALLAG